jgi:hypothetical protein
VLASLRGDLQQLQLLGRDLQRGLALAKPGAAAPEPGAQPDFAGLDAGALAPEASALVDSLTAGISSLLEYQLQVGPPACSHRLPACIAAQRREAQRSAGARCSPAQRTRPLLGCAAHAPASQRRLASAGRGCAVVQPAPRR